ncbi:MAG TPA: shikimate dehydrogenase [Planctomycetota bacterium]|jgi:3-dehydroquinate dehydratase/shikimate dehydrogenase|nr:shikimate dehydrogenase [Planctomycetota bacterium]
MICAVIRTPSSEEAVTAMAEARRAGADLCELRIDYLRDPDLARILASKPLPVLATVRPTWEGGQYAGDEALRFGLLEDACLHGADYVDVEFRAYKDFQRRNAKLVVSYHDFEKTPEDLERIAKKMAALEPLLVKIACQTRSIADLARLVRLQKTFPSPIAVIAMGEIGEPLRVLYHRYGGRLTFVSLKAGLESAPGQVTVEEMVRLYQGKTIDDATEVYGVIGDPVAHSKSPLLFNDVFKHLGMNARYVRIKVDDPAGLRELAEALELKGCSVTIPHKQAVAGLVDEADEIVKGVGAANTVTVKDGRLIGANTDLPGAMEAIRDAAVKKWSHGIYGMRALVLGAGGVSRAIAWGLKREAARVVIANRTFDRGKALAEELGVDFVRWESLMDARAQIVVNGTSVGMTPKTEESPVDSSLFKKDMVVMDTVYTPRNTRFLKEARAAGALGIDGVEMFLRQANHQFKLWKGRPIPTEILKEFSQKL